MENRLNLPPLNALRVFEAAARHESFRLAADELSITQSAVSHQISNLEQHLGIALFQRTGRNVRLTEAGIRFFPQLRDAFQQISSATRLVTQPAQQELTVQVYVTMAARWLMPRLHRLQRQSPELLVRFNASQMDWEFDPRGADLGIICTSEPNRAGIDYLPLMGASLIAVCSPLLFNGSAIADARDIVTKTLLQVYTTDNDWKVWLAAAGIADFSQAGAVKFDSYLLAMEAASDGQGIAIVPDFLAAPDLKSGRLVQPVSLAVPQPAKWYLVARSGTFSQPAAARFRDWLMTEIGQ